MAVAMQCSDSFSMLQPSMSVSCNCNGVSTGGGGVKIGGLWKRSQGLSRFTKHNYKHRVFILTDQALSYYRGTVDRVGQCKGRVQLDKVRAVEFVDISAFNLAHSMQVVYHSKKSGFTTLYIIATTKEECADWVTTLRQVCYFNRDMLMHYHPGALLKNKWSCCRQRGQSTLGCQPTYHLLTRSSSRYAQMRRKDTLTNSQRWTRLGSQLLFDRRCGAAGVSTDVEDVTGERDSATVTGGVRSPQGQGLSNSCVELSSHPPHSKELFSPLRLSLANTDSKRSSKNSNDQSVGVGSMLLTRVSVTTAASDGVEEEERREGGGEQDRQSGTFTHGTPKSRIVSRGNRSQVAPAWTTSCSSSESVPCGSSNRQSYEFEHRTLPRSFKARPTRQGEGGGRNRTESPARSPGRGRRELKGEEDPTPVPPPRAKRGSGSLATHYTPSTVITSITEHSHRGRALPSTLPSSSSAKSQLKHSKTFTLHGRKNSSGFSHSTGALTKPLIEPKVSLSNPNIIHV